MCQDGDFRLQPRVEEVQGLINRYHAEPDKECLDAGERIRNGGYSKENLRVIYRWKMQSWSYLGQEDRYFNKNTDDDVADILSTVVGEVKGSDDCRRALRELQSLKGVGLPVASAILTAIFPGRFTVIDVMALRALGVINPPKVMNDSFYVRYLTYCRAKAKCLGISLRDFDRALWQWGHDNPPKNSN